MHIFLLISIDLVNKLIDRLQRKKQDKEVGEEIVDDVRYCYIDDSDMKLINYNEI